MGSIKTYTLLNKEIAYYQFSAVGNEGFGYTGNGNGNFQSIINALNEEIDTIVRYANSDDFTSQQKLDFYRQAIDVFTDVVADLETHYSYFYAKYINCGSFASKPFRNCVKKDGHSRVEISYKANAVASILLSYRSKLEQLILLLEQTQENLETDLNNQQLVAETNIEIARANEILLAVQLFELDVREKNAEMNIRVIIVPLALFSLLAFLYYRAFVK
tara:strand:- start:7924 stop:8577 length:654 start_codon:yes stop_codon:yes gene_type:complete